MSRRKELRCGVRSIVLGRGNSDGSGLAEPAPDKTTEERNQEPENVGMCEGDFRHQMDRY